MVVVRNVLHVEGAHNAFSQSMLMGREPRIVPANGYGLRTHAAVTGADHRRRGLGELVGVARQVGWLFQLDVVSAGVGTPQVGLGRSRVQEEV